MHLALLPTCPISLPRGVARGLLAAAGAWLLAGASVPATAGGGKDAAAATVDFDIPAQPLADALVAYGAATGVEVYYDGALALGRRSAPLKGSFLPAVALGLLLRGSGYVPRVAGPDTFTLAAAPAAPPQPARVSDALIHRYEPYFAALQARIVAALCGRDTAQAGELVFSLSVDAAGVVSRAEILAGGKDPALDAAVAAGLTGLSIGERPPAGLPQPVTMAIYPPAPGEARGCAAAGASRAGP
jgi:hypothetical protein